MVRRWLPLIVMMALAGCGELPNAALDLGVVTPSDSGSSAPDAPTPPSPPPSQRISDLPCQPFTAKSEKAG